MPQASSIRSLNTGRFSRNKDRGNFYPEVEAGRGFGGLLIRPENTMNLVIPGLTWNPANRNPGQTRNGML
jgi:hypothetical protein